MQTENDWKFEVKIRLEERLRCDAKVRPLLSRIDTLEARLKEVREELPKIKPTHFDCEGDTWFGCPKSENGCADKRKGDKCNCGAEKALEVYGRIHAVATGKE